MTAFGVMGVTTPAERLTRGGVGVPSTLGAASSRSPPYSTCRLAQHEQISRSRQSSTVVPAPYRAAISAGSGSTWWLSRHHTMKLGRGSRGLPWASTSLTF